MASLIYCQLLLLIGYSQSLAPEDHSELAELERHNFLVGIAQVGSNQERLSECGQDLDELLLAISQRQPWSSKVLDSFGSAPSSFNWGNYFWYSSPALCRELNDPYSISFSPSHQPPSAFNITSPMPLEFTVLYMNFSSPSYIELRLPFERYLSLGLCLPSTCNASALARYADLFFERNIFEVQRNFALRLASVEAKQPRLDLQIFQRTSSLIFITLALCLLLLSIAAELQPSAKSGKRSYLGQLLICFRLSANYRQSTSLEQDDNYLPAIAGLRCLICLWVTVFHVYYYGLYAMSNVPLIFAKLEDFLFQPIMQACFYVDIFFVLSAFLLVYHFLRQDCQVQQIRRNGAKANSLLFLKALARRYLRLTPVLVLTMLLSDALHNALNAFTPFRLGRHSGLYCKNTWWHNLLYIQNWLNLDDVCCSWTWYLACEMQYFVLCLALLFLYAKRPILAKAAYLLLVLICLPGAWLSSSQNELTFHIDSIYGTLNQVYAKPWTRILPYLGGVFGGWLLHTQRSAAPLSPSSNPTKSSSSSFVWRLAFWLLACLSFLATSFMSYWRSTPAVVVAAIMSLGKLLFALVASLLIVLCSHGHGGPLRWLLEARLWRVLDKFCYSIYMLAPVLVFASFGLRQTATSFSELGSSSDFVSIVALSLAVAWLSWWLLERPLERVTQLLLPRDRN